MSDQFEEPQEQTVEEPKKKVGNPLFATKKDANKEIDGEWHTYTAGEVDGKIVEVRFKIRRAGGQNKEFERIMTEKKAPYRSMILANKGVLPDEINMKLVEEVFSEHIIADWENVQDSEGNFIPCTPENVLMIVRELPEVFKTLLELSYSGQIFLQETREEDAKN